jgi:hypothetical protein
MTTITAPPRTILAAAARWGHGLSEFSADRALNGTCTQTALACCVAAVDGTTPTTAQMVGYTRDMIARRDAAGNPLAGANGACTLAHIAWYASAVLGKHLALQWDYQEPLQADWLAELRTHAGVNPILLQVAHGANLIDAETGVRPEAAARGLRYHAIAVVGKQMNGYLCCDGDNPQATSRFQVYDRAALVAAVPCGLLMLSMPTAPVALPKPPPPVLSAPVPDASAGYRAALAQIVTLATNALKA